MEQAVEFDVLEFVRVRFAEIGIADDADQLIEEAEVLRDRVACYQRKKLVVISLGSVFGLVGSGAMLEQARDQAFNAPAIVLSLLLLTGATFAIDFWLQNEKERRFRSRIAAQSPYEIPSAEILARVLEPIRVGRAKLAFIAGSGDAIGFTPVSNRPIERYVSGEALDDAWLPSEIFHRRPSESPSKGAKQGRVPEYVVIVSRKATVLKRAPDRWKRYYLWHLPPAYVASIFDQALTIYSNDPLKRKKARFGLLLASERLAQCDGDARKFPSQAVLTNQLKNHLKLEANKLQHAGEIDERDARMFENIGMSGRPKETDPTEARSKQNDGADGWFEQLLSGINNQICPALREQVLKEYPTLEEFKSG